MRQGKERSARGEVKEKERNGEGQSENKLRAGAKWTGCRSTLRALYQVNLHSPLPLLLFQSVTGGSVTNTFFHPSLPRAPSPSSILPLTFPSSPPPFPLSHFISLHLRLQFPSAPFPQSDRLSLRRPPSPSRCFKSSLYGSGSVNLAGIFSYRFLFFFCDCLQEMEMCEIQ